MFDINCVFFWERHLYFDQLELKIFVETTNVEFGRNSYPHSKTEHILQLLSKFDTFNVSNL